jgi:transketolase
VLPAYTAEAPTTKVRLACFDMFDYDVYALCGDGCMMEGISSEAASLAGHLKLANLCWIYDNNNITIEGQHRLGM